MRIAAYRAMRRADLDVLPVAAHLARDTDPGVRREVALSMRDQPAAKSLDILVEIARGYDGQDRSYLEALGTGATGKEAALYDRLRRELGVKADPLTWSPTFARIAWRLHVPAAVPDLLARAQSPKLSLADRRLAVDTLAFVKDPAASKAMLTLADAEQPVARAGDVVAVEPAVERLDRLRAGAGAQDGRDLRSRHDRAEGSRSCRQPAGGSPELSVDEIARLTGDAARGKTTAARCLMCHADRRHRRRARTGARWLGPRQVRRGDRHGARPPQRRDRARLRRHRAQAPRTA